MAISFGQQGWAPWAAFCRRAACSSLSLCLTSGLYTTRDSWQLLAWRRSLRRAWLYNHFTVLQITLGWSLLLLLLLTAWVCCGCAEAAEHDLVIKQLEPMDKTRKCYRLIGDVLVERTVAETLPAGAQTHLGGCLAGLQSVALLHLSISRR
jgi:hypothetical protein